MDIYKEFSFIKGEYFQYTFTPIINLANLGTEQKSITIDNDYHYVITNIYGLAQTNGNPGNVLNFSLQMNDSSTSKNFFDKDTNSAIVVSNSRFTINPLPIHRLAPKKTTIIATVTNNVGDATAIDVFLSLRGYKLYTKRSQEVMISQYLKAQGLNKQI